MGRPHTPLAIKEANGSWRAREHPNSPTLTPVKRLSIKPPAVDRVAVWNELVGAVAKLRVLTTADRIELELACDALIEYRNAMAIIREHGATMDKLRVLRIPSGGERYAGGEEVVSIGYEDRPEVSRSIKLREQLSKLLGKFGLSPSDRVHLEALPDTPKKNPDDVFEGAF